MVATPETIPNDPSTIVLDMLEQMEQFADAGDWQRVQVIAAKLCDLMPRISPSERRQALLSANRSTEKVQSQAQFARREVSEKLTALRRGQSASKAYESTTGSYRASL